MIKADRSKVIRTKNHSILQQHNNISLKEGKEHYLISKSVFVLSYKVLQICIFFYFRSSNPSITDPAYFIKSPSN